VGHSGGTLLGIKTAHRHPEKIHAYVGVAQIVNNYQGQKLSYDFVVEEAEESGDARILDAIRAIGPPPYDTVEKEHEKAKYIIRYGGFTRGSPLWQLGMVMLSYLASPEYSLLDAFRTINGKGLNFTMDAMYEEIKDVNLAEEIRSIGVPVYFFAGRYDMIAPTVLVEDFYNTLDAEKGKELVVFEDSAHWPMIEETEKYQNLLINVVLKESQGKLSDLPLNIAT
jgi:pimeloyl-ACP methyl ester carboxylesterase